MSAARASTADGNDVAWNAAFVEKTAAQQSGAIVLCALGIGLLAVIGRNPFPRHVGMACMAAIVVVLGLTRRRGAYWPWIVCGVLSVGPMYSFGLHSGIAAVMVPLVFVGGLFRGHGFGARQRRGRVLLAICASHGLWFVLIVAGVLPDQGNVPVLAPGHGAAEPYVLHLVQQAVYVAAFVAGQAVDRRLQGAVDLARAASGEAARQETELATTRGDLDKILRGDGIFTGATVGGYRVGPLLGRGGMGEVYDARDGERRIALKVVRPDHIAEPTAIARFRDEARVLTRVRSDHVARVLAVGGVDDGLPYIAMEYVGGESLAARLRARGAVPAAELVGLVGDIAAGLRDVHAAGVVHLDVKPSNIILTGGASPRWTLVDFGVARLLAGPSSLVERHGGTPQYMAPEQAAGERVDTRSDLYALALVVYRALVGRPAFTGAPATGSNTAGALDVVGQPRHLTPRDPRRAGPIAHDLELFLRIALAHAPDDRFATAAELATAFIAAAEGELPDSLRRRARDQLAREPWRRDE